MKLKMIPVLVLLSALAVAAFAQVGPFRQQAPIMVTATATDTTITFDRYTLGVNIYSYDDDMWISYEPGSTDPVLIPAERSYYIQSRVRTLTLHRSLLPSRVLVTAIKE